MLKSLFYRRYIEVCTKFQYKQSPSSLTEHLRLMLSQLTLSWVKQAGSLCGSGFSTFYFQTPGPFRSVWSFVFCPWLLLKSPISFSYWLSLSRSRDSTFHFQTQLHFPFVWPFYLFLTTWIASKSKQTTSCFVILLSNYFLLQTGQPWLLSKIFHCAIRTPPNSQTNK